LTTVGSFARLKRRDPDMAKYLTAGAPTSPARPSEKSRLDHEGRRSALSRQQLAWGLLQNPAKTGCASTMTPVTAPANRTKATAAMVNIFFMVVSYRSSNRRRPTLPARPVEKREPDHTTYRMLALVRLAPCGNP
jgi:hypothetical protein